MSIPNAQRQLARDYAAATGATYTQALEAVSATPTVVADGLVWQPMSLIERGEAPNIYGPARRIKKMVGLLESSARSQDLSVHVRDYDALGSKALDDIAPEGTDLVICDANHAAEVKRRDLMASLGLTRGKTPPTCVAIAFPTASSTIEDDMFADLRAETSRLRTQYVQHYEPAHFIDSTPVVYIDGEARSGKTNMCRWLAQYGIEVGLEVFVLASNGADYDDLDVTLETQDARRLAGVIEPMKSMDRKDIMVIIDDFDSDGARLVASQVKVMLSGYLVVAARGPKDSARSLVRSSSSDYTVIFDRERPDQATWVRWNGLSFPFAIPKIEMGVETMAKNPPELAEHEDPARFDW